jgi:3-oxoacyl-[acyl-carrier-protein] synthase III
MLNVFPRIVGLGSYLPERVVNNAELSASLGVTEDWIVERCGVRERRYAAVGEGTSSMAAEAVRCAAKDAGWQLDDIDFLILATLSPDHFFPGSGVYTQSLLGLPNIGVMDIRNQCTGFLYSLVTADALIQTGRYKRVMVVGAETHSHCLEVPNTNKEVAVLFGDGAAAVALDDSGLRPMLATSTLHADGQGAGHLMVEMFDFRKRPYVTPADIEANKHIPVMNGVRVFLRAVAEMVATAERLVRAAGITLADVDLVIPHQANLRINETVRKRLGMPAEKFFNNVQLRGNTTAASIPLAMTEARAAGVLRPGQLVLVVAFGSGFTWGGALVKF